MEVKGLDRRGSRIVAESNRSLAPRLKPEASSRADSVLLARFQQNKEGSMRSLFLLPACLIVEIPAQRNARIVDDDVEARKVGDRRLSEVFDLLAITDIDALRGDSPAVGGAHLLRDGIESPAHRHRQRQTRSKLTLVA